MRIIGYAYEAAMHCPACTIERFGTSTEQFTRGDTSGRDEHGIPYKTDDREGNPLSPVFSTDEPDPLEYCDDCQGEIG